MPGSGYIGSLQMHWSVKALLGPAPKVNFSPEGFKPSTGRFFTWCCCEHVIGENTFRKKEHFQHGMAPPACRVTLAAAQIPLGTGSSWVCFPSGSILMTLSVTCGYHPDLSCLNLTTRSLSVSLLVRTKGKQANVSCLLFGKKGKNISAESHKNINKSQGDASAATSFPSWWVVSHTLAPL